jgi:hypothetical protein
MQVIEIYFPRPEGSRKTRHRKMKRTVAISGAKKRYQKFRPGAIVQWVNSSAGYIMPKYRAVILSLLNFKYSLWPRSFPSFRRLL